MSSDLKHLVFAYGTLKRGEPNFKWLNEEAKGRYEVLAVGKTKIKRPLVIGSRYNVPYLLDHTDEEKSQHVVGEILSVDDEMLNSLDVFEDAPKYYTRMEEIVIVTQVVKEDSRIQFITNTNLKLDGETTCWAYLLQNFKPDLLNYEFFENYASNGDHGKLYNEREGRDQDVDYYPDVKTK